MSEDVRGWCLGRDSQGAPTLSECAVMKGVEGRYFAGTTDRDGNAITVRTYQRGETFFTDKEEALKELIGQIDTVKARHYMVIAYLDDQQEMALHLLQLEKEAGDAGR